MLGSASPAPAGVIASPANAQLPPDKQERLYRATAQQPEPIRDPAEKAARIAADPVGPGTFDDSPPERLTGILEASQSLWPPMEYRIENQWGEVAGDELVWVFAGAYGEAFGDRAGDGIAIIVRRTADTEAILSTQLVEAPPGAGALRVDAANGEVLTLSSSSGRTFKLDVNDPHLG